MDKNELYYVDNLDVLRKYIAPSYKVRDCRSLIIDHIFDHTSGSHEV